MIQTRDDLRLYLQEDRRVNLGNITRKQLLKARIKDIGGYSAYRFLYALRHLEYYINNSRRSPLHKLACGYWRMRYGRLAKRYRIEIPPLTTGYGLRISHTIGGGIVFSICTVGNYLDVRQFTTIGIKTDGRAEERPVLGDHVYLGCGVSIIGTVHIGDHAVIGAGSVVTKDIPAHAIAVGNPCRVISIKEA